MSDILGVLEEEEPDQMSRVIRLGEWAVPLAVLAGFLPKLEFIRKCTDEPEEGSGA